MHSFERKPSWLHISGTTREMQDVCKICGVTREVIKRSRDFQIPSNFSGYNGEYSKKR